MRKQDKVEGQQEIINEFEAKQRNIVWPDPLVNSRSVNLFLWKGSAKPTRVQRIGALVFGLFFLIAAAAFASMALESRSVLLGLFTVGWLYVGAKVLRNSQPKESQN